MAKFALLIEYDGSNFCGWQIQANAPTIQGHIDRALSSFANESITTIAAGRTDSGVHATHQVVHFETQVKRQLQGWVQGVNSKLPLSIRVKAVVEVADSFDARFSALSRTYHYYLLTKPVNSALFNNHVGWYYRDLDLRAMQQAALVLIGRNDFSSFRASACQANTPIREMHTIEIVRQGDLLRFELTANAFLHHMVRNIVGALIYVGNQRINIDDFKKIFADKNRKLAPPTLMPNGLYLVDVKYPEPLFVSDTATWLFGAKST